MKKRGQMIVIAALLMAILLVSLLPITYMATTHYRFMRYKSVKEITANIASEFRRGLEAILATSTHIYNKTFYLEPGRIVAKKLFNRWVMTLLKAYSGVGIQVNVSSGDILLQPAKDGYPEIRIEEGEIMKCFWYFPRAISAIYATMSLNLTEYGLYGWNISRLVLLNLTINTDQMRIDYSKDMGWFNMTLLKEYQEPVNDLAEGTLIVRYYDENVNNWKIADIINITYRGAGDYTIFFKYPHDDNRYKHLEVMIVDTRGIMVEATTYRISTGIEFTITRNTPNITVTNETYTLEAVLGGKWYWNGHEIDISGEFPPIPPLPIKQFRVNISEASGWREVPVQYEVWKLVSWHGHDIWVPVDLAIPFERVNSSMRIVFQVNFPPGNQTRKIRIWWLYDVDAMPPPGPTDLEYFENLHIAKTNMFWVQFLDSLHQYYTVGDTLVDYKGIASLLMKHPSGYHFGPLDLQGFETASSGWIIKRTNLSIWRPYGDSPWNIKFTYKPEERKINATVRLIAVLNTSKVCDFYSGEVRDNFYDTLAIVLINANVPYMQVYCHIYWKQSHSGRGLWLFRAMGQGYPNNFGYLRFDSKPFDQNMWVDEDTYSGIFQFLQSLLYPHAHGHIKFAWPLQFLPMNYPAYWIAHWNDTYGRAFILDNSSLLSLYTISDQISGSGDPYVAVTWIKEIFPYTRELSIELEVKAEWSWLPSWLIENHPQITIPNDFFYKYHLVEWRVEGNLTKDVVNMYYYMFLEKNPINDLPTLQIEVSGGS